MLNCTTYKILNGIKLTDNKIKELVEDLKQATKAENKFFTNSLRALRKDYDKIENRINNAFDLLTDGSITKDLYNKKFKEYTEKQQSILAEINLHDKTGKEHYITANAVLNLAQKAKNIFESSEVAEKQKLLNFLLQNLELKGRKLLYKLKTPFDTMLLANSCSDLLRG